MPLSQFTLQMPINLFTSIHLNPLSLKGAIWIFKEFQRNIAIYILLFVTIYILREYFLDIILRNELNINVWHMILITSILYHVNDSCSCTYFILHLYIDSISISMNKIHIVMTEVFMLVYIKKKLVLTTFIQRIICSKDICNETILLIRMCRGLLSNTDIHCIV